MMRSTLILTLLTIYISVGAQPIIDFRETTFDFGTFSESDKYATHTFNFTNIGDAPLVITNVRATCGCTTPEYTTAPIAQGESGEIKITYSASGRPGKFSKVITVIANTVIPETTLSIKGDVKESSQPVKDDYTYNIEGLKLKTLHIMIGDIYKGEKRSYNIDIKNDTTIPLTITPIHLPGHITTTISPKVLQPKEKGKITVTYNTRKLKEWGYQNEEIPINIYNGDKKPTTKKMTLFANIHEDFRNITTAQLIKSPKITLHTPLLYFGEVSKTQNTSKSVEIHNTGKLPLHIRKISSLSPAITAKTSKDKIKSDGKYNLTITINPQKSNGKIINERIIIITNDPKDPVTYLQVTAYIK
ncbi:MAG: DUF1573 domain-containing protein [Bacteroidales bacterium]